MGGWVEVVCPSQAGGFLSPVFGDMTCCAPFSAERDLRPICAFHQDPLQRLPRQPASSLPCSNSSPKTAVTFQSLIVHGVGEPSLLSAHLCFASPWDTLFPRATMTDTFLPSPFTAPLCPHVQQHLFTVSLHPESANQDDFGNISCTNIFSFSP